jgi:hypothetical protein
LYTRTRPARSATQISSRPARVAIAIGAFIVATRRSLMLMASSGGGGGTVVGGAVVGGAVDGGTVGAAVVGSGFVGPEDGAVVARVVEARLGSVTVVESLSSPLHAPAISRAISTQGATRRAREGLTPATIPAAVAPLTAVGGRARGDEFVPAAKPPIRRGRAAQLAG